MTLLKVENLAIVFGGLRAVSGFDLELVDGDLVGLIGPNGAGKTTVFNMLTGVYLPTEGSITFRGKSIVGLKPYQITQRGMARTFQNIRLFGNLSVLDNVRIAFHHSAKHNAFESFSRLTARYVTEEDRIRAKAQEYLSIFGLEDRLDEISRNLPYGQQRRLEIARALAAGPKVLLLDEPAAGMNPQETAELVKLIRWIRDEFKLTVLLIEHDMSLVMNLCERIQVLEYGQTIAVGSPAEISSNPRVIEAYLGEEVAADA